MIMIFLTLIKRCPTFTLVILFGPYSVIDSSFDETHNKK